MNSIYLIVNNNNFIINRSIQKIISKYSDAEVIYYDMQENLIDRAVEDLDTYNFLSNKKIIVLTNCLFLTAEKSTQIDTSKLEKYLQNPSLDNILIITANKLDERKNIVKLIKKNSIIIEENVTPESIIKDNLDNYKMEFKAINLLIEYTLGNYDRIVHELEKLKLYKYNTKEITEDDVKDLVHKDIDDNIFELIDSIIKRNKKKAYEIYIKLLQNSNDVNKLLIMLANKFRLLYQVKVLSKRNYSDNDIGKIIDSHPYPIKLARGLIFNFSEKELLEYLNKLATIDYEIKTGKTYKNIALEMFIISI